MHPGISTGWFPDPQRSGRVATMLLPACQLAGREFSFWASFMAAARKRGSPARMSMWTSWILLALLLFWAVGAYNRLIRLRSAVLQAFGALDAHWQRWIALVAEYAASRIGMPEPDTRPAGVGASLRALDAAAAQFSASLAVVRARPLDGDAVAALLAAEKVLDTAWQGMTLEQARSADGVAPPALAPWIHQREQLALHVGEARRLFNEAVARYNHGAGQFPANLLAWLFGMTKGSAL